VGSSSMGWGILTLYMAEHAIVTPQGFEAVAGRVFMPMGRCLGWGEQEAHCQHRKSQEGQPDATMDLHSTVGQV